MLTDNLITNVPKMSYFVLKSSKVVSFWRHILEDAPPGPRTPLLKFLDPPLYLIKFFEENFIRVIF